MITCSEAVRQLWDYMERDLDDGDRGRVEHHLSLCRRCCGEAEFAAALRDLLRTSVSPSMPPDVEARLGSALDRLDVAEEGTR